MRVIGRLGLSVLTGAWAVAFWAAAFGAHPVLPAGDYSWWPGALYSMLIAALVFAALQSRPVLADSLQRVFGGDVPVWVTAVAIGLLWLVRLRWAAPMGGVVATELLAAGLGGMLIAGLTAPDRPAPPARIGVPQLNAAPASAPADAIARTLSWRGRGVGASPVEAYALDVEIDKVRLEAQRVGPHDLIEARWSGYCIVTPEIEQLARELRVISEREQLDRLDEVRLALDLVAEGCDTDPGPLYPLETLSGEQAGPGARAILAATLLSALGYRPALLRAGERTALAIAGVVPLPELFLQLEGEPAVFAEFRPEGYSFGDVPDRDRAVPWSVVPLRK